MQRLQKFLNFALRVISGRRKFDHISDVRGELGWPTARQLYEYHSLFFLHKIRCTEKPEALFSQLCLYVLTTPTNFLVFVKSLSKIFGVSKCAETALEICDLAQTVLLLWG